VLDGNAEIPTRQLGTTIPGAPPTAPEMMPRPLVTDADKTRVDTAFAPTYLETPRVASPARPAASRARVRPGLWPALAGGGAVVAIAAVVAWQLSPHRDAARAKHAAAASAGAASVVAAPVGEPPAVPARPAPTAVPVAVAAPASNGAATPPSIQTQKTLRPLAARSTAASPTEVDVRPAIGEHATIADSAGPAGTVSPAGVAGLRPSGRPVPKVTDESVAARAQAPMPDHLPAAPTASAEPATAREACGNRRFFALAACMDRRCEEARFRTGPECMAILARKANREGWAPN
jgi:hypothetical protein